MVYRKYIFFFGISNNKKQKKHFFRKTVQFVTLLSVTPFCSRKKEQSTPNHHRRSAFHETSVTVKFSLPVKLNKYAYLLIWVGVCQLVQGP